MRIGRSSESLMGQLNEALNCIFSRIRTDFIGEIFRVLKPDYQLSSPNSHGAHVFGIEEWGDSARLEKIDKLRELGIGNYVELPQLVVVGDQSSGKSSVLEGLTDLPFPRDSTLCTRFATQINFRRADQDRVSISIIACDSSDPARKERLKRFKEDESKAFTRDRFSSILSKACEEMGILAPGKSLAPGQSTFSEDVLKIELFGPTKPHLSVIDVPGIFRTPTEGLTTREDILMVKRMVREYIENSRTIILAVIPANVDIATQEILAMAEVVDPTGQRTLGVLTKPDLVDKGTEQDVLDLVLDRKNKLKLGYFIVRNRGQQDRSTSAGDRHRQEADFFNSRPWSSGKPRLGILAMKNSLIELLNEITRREYPKVKEEIIRRLKECNGELRALGSDRKTHEEQRKYLLNISMEFQENVQLALQAQYAQNKIFQSSPELKLATRLVDLNERFANDMEKKGHTIQFLTPHSSPTSESFLQTTPASKYTGNPMPNGEPIWFKTEKPPGNSLITPTDEYPELRDVIQESQPCPLPLDDDIFDWIKCKYKGSRGLELGTFNPSILLTLFQEQTSKWAGLAETYISDVIHAVHKFIETLLSTLCLDGRVKVKMWSLMLDELIKRYKKAMEHMKFIVSTEREGMLLTANSHFSENLQEAKIKRSMADIHHSSPEHGEPGSKASPKVEVNKTPRPAPVGTLNPTIGDIHDILETYYQVARKRFVDTIYIQSLGYHLITGPETPLKVLRPSFISELEPEQLEMIAAEDTISISRRKHLNKEIETLLEARSLLVGE